MILTCMYVCVGVFVLWCVSHRGQDPLKVELRLLTFACLVAQVIALFFLCSHPSWGGGIHP